jgi:voltage-gated sodium channel
MLGVITVNAVVLGLETFESIDREHHRLLDTLNDVLLGVFVVELAIRSAAHWPTPTRFARSGWNVFDFVVVTASFLPGLRENATLLRMLRLLRVVRAVHAREPA